MKRIALTAWVVLVAVGGGLTLMMQGPEPVGWDDWWRDAPASTSCPDLGSVTGEAADEAWPTPAASLPQGQWPQRRTIEPEPARPACAYRVDD